MVAEQPLPHAPTGRPQLTSKLVVEAYAFANAAHQAIGQRRKYTEEPYIVHPVAVARTVATVAHTEAMLAAALLHDTVEDTAVTQAQILEVFGQEVSDLVGWLTDVSRPEDGNRATRKAIDLVHTASAPPEAKTIKLADLIDNTYSIVRHDRKFALVYLPEKARLLDVLREGDPCLWNRASDLLQASLQLLRGPSVAA